MYLDKKEDIDESYEDYPSSTDPPVPVTHTDNTDGPETTAKVYKDSWEDIYGSDEDYPSSTDPPVQVVNCKSPAESCL